MTNSFISVFGSAGGGGGLPLTGGTLTGALTVNVASGNLIVGQLSGSEKFKVTSDGILSLGNNFNAQTYGVADSWTLGLQGNSTCAFYGSATAANRQIRMTGGGYFGWSAVSPDGALDLILNRAAAATLQLGVDAASGVNQTIKACNGTAGVGGNLTLSGGTGTTTNGTVVITGSKFSVTSAGTLSLGNTAIINPESTNGIGFGVANNPTVAIYGGSTTTSRQIRLTGGVLFGWCPTTPDGTLDLFLGRSAAANLGLGEPLASGWISQTIAASGGRIGTDINNSPTNTLTIAGSVSTGTGTGGNLRLGVYGTNGSSGSAIGTLNTVLTVVAARKVINLAGIPTSSAGLSSGDVYSNSGVLTIVP